MSLRKLLTALAAAAATATAASAQATGNTCLADPTEATGLVAEVQSRILYSRGDSVHLARGGLLPVDTAEVALVLDETTCVAAVAAYNAAKPGAGLTQAYVIRAGSQRYVVWDLRDPHAHYHDIMIFDPNWQLVKWVVG